MQPFTAEFARRQLTWASGPIQSGGSGLLRAEKSRLPEAEAGLRKVLETDTAIAVAAYAEALKFYEQPR